MLGAMLLQRARSFLSSDAMLTVGTTVFAGALWATATFTPIVLLCVAIAFGGAWTAVMSLMSTLMQNLAPDWVRARASAVFMLVYMGAWAAEAHSGHHGTHFSLVAAAIGTAASPVLVLFSRLPDAAVDLTAWEHWGKPMLVGEVEPDQGPVLVTVEYEIETKHADEFIAALEKFSRVRRRDGASRWGVYYDTEHPTRWRILFLGTKSALCSAGRYVSSDLRTCGNDGGPRSIGNIIFTASKAISLNPALCASRRLGGMFLKYRPEAGMLLQLLV